MFATTKARAVVIVAAALAAGLAVQGPLLFAAPSPASRVAVPYDIEQIVAFTIPRGRLQAEVTAPDPVRKEDWTRLAVKGSQGIWRCRMTRQTPDGVAVEPTFELSYRDAGNDRDDGYCSVTAFCGADELLITGRIWRDGRTVTVTYHGRLNSSQLEVFVQDQDNSTEPVLNEYAESLQELYDEHTEEVERYFAPMLKKLARKNLLGPGAADVYAVFQDVPSDPSAVSRLEQLLARMESPLPAQREHAAAELEQMGSAGLLSALRYDHSKLSPEQRGRMSAFIALHQRRNNLTLARQDLLFLTECLDHDDQRVREAAKQAIESLTGHAIVFDPAAEFDVRDAAATKLRGALRRGEWSAARHP